MAFLGTVARVQGTRLNRSPGGASMASQTGDDERRQLQRRRSGHPIRDLARFTFLDIVRWSPVYRSLPAWRRLVLALASVLTFGRYSYQYLPWTGRASLGVVRSSLHRLYWGVHGSTRCRRPRKETRRRLRRLRRRSMRRVRRRLSPRAVRKRARRARKRVQRSLGPSEASDRAVESGVANGAQLRTDSGSLAVPGARGEAPLDAPDVRKPGRPVRRVPTSERLGRRVAGSGQLGSSSWR